MNYWGHNIMKIMHIMQNFLALNIQNAGRAQVKRPPSQERPSSSPAKCEKGVSNHQRGIIPQ